MEPAFGCGLHEYVFAPATATTAALVTQQVYSALLRWEPRIDVLDVRAEPRPETPNALFIRVDYRIRTNNAFHNLVYPFYLTEG